MHKSIGVLTIALMAMACGVAMAPAGEVLITPAEAKLPPGAPMVGALNMRGLTRGPSIEQISPDPGSANIKSPLPLHIKFITHNETTVDPGSVTVTYLKAQSVDLTPRLKTHLTAAGIDMSDAEVPPGAHVLRIEMKDSQGRIGSGLVKLSVAP